MLTCGNVGEHTNGYGALSVTEPGGPGRCERIATRGLNEIGFGGLLR
jgi:hypothetical protein